MSSLRHSTLTLGLLVGIASSLWVALLGRPEYPLDDAYIVQHAVQGLLTGEETRFIGARPVDGATSPIHLLLVTSLSLILPIAWSQWVIGTLALFAYLLGILKLSHQNGLSTRLSWLLVFLGVLSGVNVQHLMNGLETTLAMASITWCLVLFQNPGLSKPGAFLLGVLPFVRPELGALSLLLTLRWLAQAHSLSVLKKELPGLLLFIALGIAIPILFIGATGGHLFPETASAKAYFFAEGCLPLGQKLILASVAWLGFYSTLGVAGIGFAGLVNKPSSHIALGFISIFFIAFALRLPGAFTHNWFRYPYVLMPFLILGWIDLLAIPNGKIVRITRTIFCASLLLAVIGLPKQLSEYQRGIEVSRVELAGVSDWINAHLEDNAILLVHDAGYISLKGTQSLVDLVGLKTPSNIEIHKNHTYKACSRDPSAIDLIARRNRVTHFVVLDEWDQIFHLTDGLKDTGWALNRVDGERGASLYKVYQLVEASQGTHK